MGLSGYIFVMDKINFLHEWAQERLGTHLAHVGCMEVLFYWKTVRHLPVLQVTVFDGYAVARSASYECQIRFRSTGGLWKALLKRADKLGVVVDPVMVTRGEVATSTWGRYERPEECWVGKTAKELFL